MSNKAFPDWDDCELTEEEWSFTGLYGWPFYALGLTPGPDETGTAVGEILDCLRKIVREQDPTDVGLDYMLSDVLDMLYAIAEGP